MNITITERIAALSPTQHALFVQLLQNLSLDAIAALSIPLADRDRPLPLSFSQQRLWFISQFEGTQGVYNIPLCLELTGQLDEPALIQSFEAILQRHEILRTRFVQQQGEPAQMIDEQLALPWQRLDWQEPDRQEIDEVAIAQRLDSFLKTELQRCFDLQAGPLFRLALAQVSGDRYYLIANFHHIITDGWSMGVLVQELTWFYRQFTQPLDSTIRERSPLPIQYADYAAWQRQWLASDRATQQIGYWKTQLAGLPPLLDLPIDRPRSPVQTFNGGVVVRTLDEHLTTALKGLATATGSTLFMVLESAFALLLSRLSRQTDVAIGTVVANRSSYELEPLIGFFVNTLVLRNDLSSASDSDSSSTDLTGRSLIERTKQMALAAFRHQEVPFEQVVEAVQPQRALSHSPLFQVAFGVQNASTGELDLPGLSLVARPPLSETAKFDLTLMVNELDDTLETGWEYNSDLFEPATIERFADYLQAVLAQLVQTPSAPIADYSLLSAQAREQVVREWNATECDRPRRCIHHWFEAQVEKTPNAIALVSPLESVQLTYQELNQKANRLAHLLQSYQPKPEQLVGICLERSVDGVVAMLAVWKAGSAYVPLDPSYPAARLAHMVNDSQIAALISVSSLSDRLPMVSRQRADLASQNRTSQDSVIQRINLDTIELANRSADNPSSAVQPNHLAYVIYTSGSTGLPKGVMVEHRGLANLAFSQIETFQVAQTSRILQIASFSFDASVSEMLMAFLAGAQLHLGQFDQLPNGGDRLSQQGITHLTVSPPALNVLSTADLAPVQHLIVAGDICSAETAAKWSHRPGFYNAYGPTETTVCAAIANCTSTEIAPPIGRPIQNAQIYLVDERLKAVPPGVPGEILIGGVGLARGYLNRPKLTAEKFIQSPFRAGEQLYRSGDLGRYRPDGTIDFMGRIDHQVKLRGFRIELGEIESALMQQDGIREAVCLVRQDLPDSDLLCAYVVTETPNRDTSADTARADAEALKQALRQMLPDYMVPAHILILTEMPLTPNGKVDRKALPQPEINRDRATTILPQTQLERQIARIWATYLQTDLIGLHDNFFDLGGHSLLMVKVFNDLKSELISPTGEPVRLEIVDLFRFPTIAALSQHLQQQSQTSTANRTQQRTQQRTAHQTNLQQTAAMQRRTVRQQFRRSATEKR